ncbi:MAG: amino acid carrier protein [Phycisphaerae bacterium]|nr:amino acid carrier protein [Phycisphaerae bacterium]
MDNLSAENIADFVANLSGWVWSVPLAILLLGCGLAFSIVTKFAQWRILTHGYACIRGKYDRPEDTGHINHFQALCAALSATIGLGNIAGVALAISVGGPGAVFWMWLVGLFGMALKFMECSLAVMFRDVPKDDADGSAQTKREVRGGPMWYMQKGLVEPLKARGNPFWVLFKALAIIFSVCVMLSSLGQGNMFQGWNVANILRENFSVPQWGSAAVVAALVALVIIGGIKRIGQVAGKLVPLMCVIYVLGATYVVFSHADEIPRYLALIVKSAFTPTAEAGGFLGVTVWIAFSQGLKRACFSNEAGEGSAAMAHAAAKTDEPIREGIVAGIGPFVDTLIICTMSALVLLMTGTWNRPAVGTVTEIDHERVTVSCDGELPEKMEALYLERIQTGTELVVYTHSGEDGRGTVKFPIAEIEADGGGWDDLKVLTLDVSALTDAEELTTVETGQEVHLNIQGAEMTRFAFDTSIKGFGLYIVTLGVCLFAFSTMISWSYYGEKGAEYLFGRGAILPYKVVFVIFVVIGMSWKKFSTVYDFSDAVTGMLVFWNLPAVLLLSPAVLRAAKDYFRRLDSGQMRREPAPAEAFGTQEPPCICDHCRHENEPGATFCARCGSKLPRSENSAD